MPWFQGPSSRIDLRSPREVLNPYLDGHFVAELLEDVVAHDLCADEAPLEITMNGSSRLWRAGLGS